VLTVFIIRIAREYCTSCFVGSYRTEAILSLNSLTKSETKHPGRWVAGFHRRSPRFAHVACQRMWTNGSAAPPSSLRIWSSVFLRQKCGNRIAIIGRVDIAFAAAYPRQTGQPCIKVSISLNPKVQKMEIVASKKKVCTNRPLRIEALERRDLLSVDVELSGATLTVWGDDRDNVVYVGYGFCFPDDCINVNVESRAGNLEINEFYPVDAFDKVRFYGFDGDDKFSIVLGDEYKVYAVGGEGDDTLEDIYDSLSNCEFSGGPGNDHLRGGVGDDRLFGGPGSDLLEGGEGDDDLYGGGGNDLLYGDAGDDLLHGGNGADLLSGGENDDDLYGDSGPGSDLLEGGEGDDAIIRFKRGLNFKRGKRWLEREIEAVDVALRALHHKTQNDDLLELKGGKTLTFRRFTHPRKGVAAASNDSRGTINVYNSAFEPSNDLPATIIHEVGHNWDSEHSRWQEWLALSGWRDTKPAVSEEAGYTKVTSKRGTWWYLTSASSDFANEYGKTNPWEDFATSFEADFVNDGLVAEPSYWIFFPSYEKREHLDAFFASLV
jgi:hypothetical protein